jgi:hypothetical protein
MSALAWWLIPITATLLAIVWVTWINRPRKPADPHDTLAEHRRFRDALERSEVASTRAAAGRSRDLADSDSTPPPADR